MTQTEALWEKYRRYRARMTRVEQKVIFDHFNAMVQGTPEAYADLSQPELEQCHHIFESAWIMARLFTDEA